MAKQHTTRSRILNTATAYMLKFGYRKVTMDEIAQGLVMSKNTIYKHFQSKVEIAQEIFEILKRQINLELILIEESNQDPTDIILKSIFFIQKELNPWYEYFLGDIKGEIPELYANFIRFRDEKINDLKTVLEKGIKKGQFRKVNSTIAVQIYLGAVDKILNPDFLLNEKISFPEAIDIIMDIWSFGIVKEGKEDASS